MKVKLVRAVAAAMMVLMVVVCGGLFYFPQLHAFATDRQEKRAVAEKHSILDLLREQETTIQSSKQEMLKQLRIELPEGLTEADISISNDYVTNTIEISIPKVNDAYVQEYPVTGNCDHIEELTYEWNRGTGILDIVLDGVYEIDTIQKDQYLYVGFVDPHDIYDKVVVIDAGHGGRAPGAIQSGSTEKEIDLAIVLKMKELFEQDTHNIGVYYTRLDDSNPSFANRVGLANKSNADLFVSVHNNALARKSSVSGTAVMYHSTDNQSNVFAQSCLTHLTNRLGSVNKGLISGDDIYIIRSAQVPVALVEVGFMTNKKELENLNSPEYQQDAAQALYDAIIETLYQ